MFLDADSWIKTSSQEETVNSSKLPHRKVERPSGLGGRGVLKSSLTKTSKLTVSKSWRKYKFSADTFDVEMTKNGLVACRGAEIQIKSSSVHSRYCGPGPGLTHWLFFALACVRMWDFRLVDCANFLLQPSKGHTYGRSPVWIRTCVRKLKSRENRLPQPSNVHCRQRRMS